MTSSVVVVGTIDYEAEGSGAVGAAGDVDLATHRGPGRPRVEFGNFGHPGMLGMLADLMISEDVLRAMGE